MKNPMLRTGMIGPLQIAALFPILLCYTGDVAGASGSTVCKYGVSYVPCTEVKAENGQLQYLRPKKWLPLWPKNSIFGDKESPIEYGYPSRREGDKSKYTSRDTARSLTTINNAQLITRKPLIFSSKQFASPDFYPYAGVVWLSQEAAQDLKLVAARFVYRGKEVLRAWKKSLSFGVTCSGYDTDMPESTYAPNDFKRKGKTCAFTRYENRRKSAIEYCFYKKGNESLVRSEVECFRVARYWNGGGMVLASREFFLPNGGAGGEGEVHCAFRGAALGDVRKGIKEFVENLFGKSSRYMDRKVGNARHFVAEGINIKGLEKGYFSRIYVRGYSLKESRSDVTADLEDWRASDKKVGVLALQPFFTVSAQFTDDIRDYREPSKAMGERLRKSFFKKFRTFIRESKSTMPCWLHII